jgi:hypothetical protein
MAGNVTVEDVEEAGGKLDSFLPNAQVKLDCKLVKSRRQTYGSRY